MSQLDKPNEPSRPGNPELAGVLNAFAWGAKWMLIVYVIGGLIAISPFLVFGYFWFRTFVF